MELAISVYICVFGPLGDEETTFQDVSAGSQTSLVAQDCADEAGTSLCVCQQQR